MRRTVVLTPRTRRLTSEEVAVVRGHGPHVRARIEVVDSREDGSAEAVLFVFDDPQTAERFAEALTASVGAVRGARVALAETS